MNPLHPVEQSVFHLEGFLLSAPSFHGLFLPILQLNGKQTQHWQICPPQVVQKTISCGADLLTDCASLQAMDTYSSANLLICRPLYQGLVECLQEGLVTSGC